MITIGQIGLAARVAQSSGDPRVDATMLVFGVIMLCAGIWLVGKWRNFWRGDLKKVGASLGALGYRWSKVGQAIYPFVWVGFVVVGLMLVNGFLAQETSGQFQRVADFAANFFIIVFFVVGTLFFSIVLFNRPRFLVPPHARDFSGLFGDWVITVVRRLTGRSNAQAGEPKSGDTVAPASRRRARRRHDAR